MKSMTAERPIKTAQANGLQRPLAVAFSIAVFMTSIWYIGNTFQWTGIIRALEQVDLAILVLGGGASIILYWVLRSIRWYILLERTNTHVPLLDLYLCTAVSLSFSIFTPLQSGEVLKIEILKKYGMLTRAPGYGSFLVERALDLITVLTIASFSLLTTLNLLPTQTDAWYILGAVFIGTLAGLLILSRIKFRGRLKQLLDYMRECVIDPRTLLVVTLITCASWASVALSWQIFLRSAGIELNFPEAMAVMSIVALINILSLIPGGLGISEAGSSQVLMQFGLVPAMAQAGSIVLRCYSFVAIALGALHLLVWKWLRAMRTSEGQPRHG